jgi:hypothetical protein
MLGGVDIIVGKLILCVGNLVYDTLEGLDFVFPVCPLSL